MRIQQGALAQRRGFATPRTRTGFQRVRGCETVLQYQFDWRHGYVLGAEAEQKRKRGDRICNEDRSVPARWRGGLIKWRKA